MTDIFISEGNTELNIPLKPIPILLTDFRIEPTEVKVGTPVHISVTATNVDEAFLRGRIYCTVDKTQLEVGHVELTPGQSQPLLWEFTPGEAKTYFVEIAASRWPYISRATAFEGFFVALPTGDPSPISINIAPTIATGSEFWAGHTVFLPYLPNCKYFLSLALIGTGTAWGKEVTAAEAWYVDQNWMLPEYFPLAYPISSDGQYTFRGIPDAEYDRITDTHGPVFQVPAKATYWRDHLLEDPLPKGVYNVMSWCKFYLIESADKDHTSYYDYWWLWRELYMGEVEIV